MAIGLKTSTPALRTSSAENAPMSIYISSRSFDFGGFSATGRQMHGQTRNHTVDPRAGCRPDFYGLRGVQLIEHRRQAALRQPLNAQVAIVGDGADDETGLVNSGDEQPMRRATAKRDNDVANIVDLRMKHREPRTELIHKLLFVPGNRSHIVERFQVVEAYSLARK